MPTTAEPAASGHRPPYRAATRPMKREPKPMSTGTGSSAAPAATALQCSIWISRYGSNTSSPPRLPYRKNVNSVRPANVGPVNSANGMSARSPSRCSCRRKAPMSAAPPSAAAQGRDDTAAPPEAIPDGVPDGVPDASVSAHVSRASAAVASAAPHASRGQRCAGFLSARPRSGSPGIPPRRQSAD